MTSTNSSTVAVISRSKRELLTIDETAAYTTLNKGQLAQRRYRGEEPRYVKLTPKTVRYDRVDLDAWLDAAERVGTAA